MFVANEFNKESLQERATKLRQDIITMIFLAGSGHPGGSLSAVEMITYLYFYALRINPRKPLWEDRDRFVLSKGHCCPVLYATLAARGYFPEKVLWTLRDVGSILQGHPDMKKTPGIDMTTGSLGQGLSAGVGMALGGKLSNRDFLVYVMVGDGEIQSGQIWEAALTAANLNLDNLTVIVDDNGLQCDGLTCNINDVRPIAPKWRAFGWDAEEVDGHDFQAIHNAMQNGANRSSQSGKPKVVIAHTIKGKGVTFMENNDVWHGKAPNEEEARMALQDIRGERND